MGGGELPLGGDDSGVGIFDVRGSGLQLARSVHRCDGNGDIQRLRRRFGARQIGLCLRDRNLVVFRIDLHQHGAFLTHWLSSTFTFTT